MWIKKKHLMVIVLLLFTSMKVAADDQLFPGKNFIEAIHKDKVVKVQRKHVPDTEAQQRLADLPHQCPPNCIQPMKAAPQVETIAELEILQLMESDVLQHNAVLIDARLSPVQELGTIPGSVNIPYPVFQLTAEHKPLVNAMELLGVRKRIGVASVTLAMEELGLADKENKTENWDFKEAKKAVVWCTGPWHDQAAQAVKGLLSQGYPAEKIYYYRGGLQNWISLGLTTVVEQKPEN